MKYLVLVVLLIPLLSTAAIANAGDGPSLLPDFPVIHPIVVPVPPPSQDPAKAAEPPASSENPPVLKVGKTGRLRPVKGVLSDTVIEKNHVTKETLPLDEFELGDLRLFLTSKEIASRFNEALDADGYEPKIQIEKSIVQATVTLGPDHYQEVDSDTVRYEVTILGMIPQATWPENPNPPPPKCVKSTFSFTYDLAKKYYGYADSVVTEATPCDEYYKK
jgi:hypothetical protein